MLTLNERKEINQRLSAVPHIKDKKKQNEELRFLLNSIPKLLEDAAAVQQQFRVEEISNSNGQKRLYALTSDMSDLFVSMCRTYGSVTWKLMQDTTKTQEPGSGIFMLSEALPKELRPQSQMPHALPRSEPDQLEK